MGKRLNKTDRAKYDRLMKKFELEFDRNGSWMEILGKLDDFAHAMDEKYGEPMAEIKGFSTGGVATSKKYVNPVTIVDNLKKKNK